MLDSLRRFLTTGGNLYLKETTVFRNQTRTFIPTNTSQGQPREEIAYSVKPLASRFHAERPPDVEHLESEHDDVEQPPAAHNRNVPLMDEFSSVSDESDDHDYFAAPRRKRRRNVRITDAVLLEEQYHLCQEQRQFFLEMTQTMHEMGSFIKTVKDEWLNHARHCNKIAEADAPTLAGDNNLEESAVSYTA